MSEGALFYLQDSRGYVGNDMLFWAKNGNGYTTDLRNAETYTHEQAQRMHNSRETDIPWPTAYIDAKTRPAVDMQYVKRDEALRGTGIVLAKPRKYKKPRIRCSICGCFISERQVFFGCPKCGGSNAP